MNEVLILALGGLAGGLVRGIVGILKTMRQGRKITGRYFLTTILISAFVGLIAGLFVDNDVRFSILAGYVGGDFLEGLYKVRFNEKYKSKK